MTSTKFYQNVEDINTVRWRMKEIASACRALRLERLADDLKALSNDLDDIADKFTELEAEISWPETQRRPRDPLSIMLQKSIEDDERARR